MYVSRLVYVVCLLEAVLWFQPNFALNNQRDMTKLLQTQTLQLNELAQNAVCFSPPLSPSPPIPPFFTPETTLPRLQNRSRADHHPHLCLLNNLPGLQRNKP